MRLLVRHGLNGKEELAIHVADRVPAGWDIMKQLACGLDLKSPFQIILYLNSTAAILPPLRAISPHRTSTDVEICYLVQTLQVPTAEHGPPRRSDGCGLGVAFACAVGRSAKLLQSFKGFRGFKRFKRFRGFKGLRAGNRQAWTPIRSH